MDDAYAALAEALDRLPNGFPRTASGVELLILRKILSPEDAALAALLGKDPEPAASVAERAGLPTPETGRRLVGLARRGVLWHSQGEGGLVYRLAPFVVGLYEAQVQTIDHELAHLVEEYFAHSGAKGIMGPLPSLHRVVPAHDSVKSEWILPYEDVKGLLQQAVAFHAGECICRKEKELTGRRACTAPIGMCLSFSATPRSPWPGDVSREQALELLDRAEELGLVHTVSNVLAGVSYVCNCCGCCCAILRGITEYGLEHSVAVSSYRASVEASVCNACGRCAERCQVGAVTVRDGVAVIDARKCIGCGLCVTGCRAGAVTLARRPEAETLRPPADFGAWERERLEHRGSGD